MAKRKSVFRAPFLKSMALRPERFRGDGYPFNLPILEAGRLQIIFDRPITFFIGDNGTGKSTLLEAIAKQCGFNLAGGSRDHLYSGIPQDMPLANALSFRGCRRSTKVSFCAPKAMPTSRRSSIGIIRNGRRFTAALATRTFMTRVMASRSWRC